MIFSDAYLIGGFNDAGNYYVNPHIYDDIWRLDLSNMQWVLLPCKLSKAVYFHSSLIHDGQIVTFGGVNEKTRDANDPEGLPDEKRINTVQTCYVKICSLEQICWNAINYYCQDLVKQTDDSLMEEGIPIKRIQELKA